MTAGPVRYDVADGVATITLDRPEQMNSLNVATKVALRDAVGSAAGDDAVRCVVLTGTGRAFCVGQDLKEHVGLLEEGADALFRTVPEHYNPLVTALATMDKPVVAAVNGVAAGAGASLAFACDLRLLADTAGFNLAFTGIGLSCDTGSSWTLPRLVGHAKAIELLYFPRTVSAAESLELGLATKVVAADELATEAAGIAARLAAGPTRAFGAVRRALNHSAGHDLESSLAFEAQMMTATGSTRDHQRAVASFVAKEKPTFEGR
ncbi:MAG TPA: enoyl-CoA hydratase-related protein [Nocardioidaceae bacterium]|nr:enoyl-CoA hydratase-related protein [Nocardioidaceae bacterium]